MSGDQILAVDDISTLNMSDKDISNLLRGQQGTVVRLRINRAHSSEFNLILFRQQIINHNIDKDYFNRCLARFQFKDYGNALDDCQRFLGLMEPY